MGTRTLSPAKEWHQAARPGPRNAQSLTPRLSGHTKIESTVRYLGIEVDDALAIAEQVDV
jgi:hypothetical protein